MDLKDLEDKNTPSLKLIGKKLERLEQKLMILRPKSNTKDQWIEELIFEKDEKRIWGSEDGRKGNWRGNKKNKDAMCVPVSFPTISVFTMYHNNLIKKLKSSFTNLYCY